MNWARSRRGVKRRGFHAIKRLIAFLYCSALTDEGGTRNGPALASPPPDDGAREPRHTPSDLILVPTAVDRETTIETDLAVIGSGAGGSVIAATVAKAGHRVLVIEAGSLQTPETFPQRELPGTESMFERRGGAPRKGSPVARPPRPPARGGGGRDAVAGPPPPPVTPSGRGGAHRGAPRT